VLVVICYYLDETIPLYALLAYAKNARGEMVPDEKRMVVALTTALKAAWEERK